MNIENTHAVRLPAEWEPQDAVMIAWPHNETDWCDMLDEVTQCYQNIATAIQRTEHLIIIYNDDIPTNDTWARDFGAITVIKNGIPTPLDFTFNAWGMKFAANNDNLITQRMAEKGYFCVTPENHRDFVLEGGSIESDGAGTLMVTTKCLLSPNRNAHLSKAEIEARLAKTFGVKQVLWVAHGEMAGDDTDAHIDTLARFAPGNTILYNAPANAELAAMEQELKSFRNLEGVPYHLVALPVPQPIYDDSGEQIPATYANFLVINGQVLVPTYNQPTSDAEALRIIAQAFPDREITGIDCNALIKQHGSLHCITMQFPKNTIKK